MKASPVQLVYEVELRAGEKLSLPESLVASVGPGRWIIHVGPVPIRDHTAFLNSFAPEDEGLYDADPPG